MTPKLEATVAVVPAGVSVFVKFDEVDVPRTRGVVEVTGFIEVFKPVVEVEVEF